jgi:methylated-DNA-[protein]-cysteine S-methyltransferase
METQTRKYFLTDLTTPFGPMAIVWWDADAGPRVRQVFLCVRKSVERSVRPGFPDAVRRSVPDIKRLSGQIRDFFAGKKTVFDLSICDWSVCGAFQERVLRAEYAIPRGLVSTYGRIAAQIGAARAGRAVGRALAENPFPIVIPCHRAVRSDGALGGYQGGVVMKRALLEMEGVAFGPTGRVAIPRFYYS